MACERVNAFNGREDRSREGVRSRVAKSISFAGTADQIVFEDVTFGSTIPGVPEPST